MDLLDKLLDKLKGKSVKACPYKTGTLAVVLTRNDTGKPVAGATVAITGPSPGTDTTNDIGAAIFEGRTPGDYQAKVTLPSSMKTWVLEEVNVAGSVSAAGSTVLRAKAQPLGSLSVSLVDDLGGTITQKVRVAISGPSSHEVSTQRGSAAFMNIAAGNYTVSATASDGRAYVAAAVNAADVKVPESASTQHKLVFVLANLATPKLVLSKAELLAVPPHEPPAQPPQAQGAPQQPPPPDPWASVTVPLSERVCTWTLSLTETLPGKPWDGEGVLSFAPGTVKLFSDAGCTQAWPGQDAGSLRFKAAQLKQGITLHARAEKPGAVNPTLDLTAATKPEVLVGAQAQAALVVDGLTVVEPIVAMEYHIALLNQELAKLQTAVPADHPIPPPTPTRLEISAKVHGNASRYKGQGKLVLAAALCELFTDEDGKTAFDAGKPIPLAQLSPGPLVLWARGKTAGQCTVTLTMDPSTDAKVKVLDAASQPLGVLQAVLEAYWYDEAALLALECPRNADAPADFANRLKAVNIPAQKAMTKAQRIGTGQLLHVQDGKKHGRAKLVLKKLDAAQVPAPAQTHQLVLDTQGKSGKLQLFDAEDDGKELVLPLKLDLKDLTSADTTYWVQASAESDAWRHTWLEAGLNRPDGGLDHKAKNHGDVACYTAVKVEKVELKVTAVANQPVVWDAGKKRYFINTQAGEAGRTLSKVANTRDVHVLGKLSKAIKGVKLHFMLLPDAANEAPAGLPGTWKPHEMKASYQHKDREDRKKLLHFHKETDDKGEAPIETLVLSGFGGDKFTPAAYITQDPRVAKFVQGHVDLGQHEPVKAASDLQVWKRFDYQLAYMKRHDGSSYGNRLVAGDVEAKFAEDFIQLDAVGAPVVKAHAYITENADARSWVQGALGAEKARTLQFALVDAITTGAPADFTLQATTGVPGLSFGWPIQGKCFDLSAQAKWFKSAEVSVHGTAIGPINIPLANVSLVDDGVNHRLNVSLAGIPALVGKPLPDIRVKVVILERSVYSGLSWGAPTLVGMRWRESGYPGQETDATLNTTCHEAGHYLGLAPKTLPDAVASASTLWYDSPGVGNHCKHGPQDCVMWHAFLLKFNFCPTCKLALRARDHVSNVNAANPF